MTPSASGRGQKISRCPRCRIAVWSNYAGAGGAVHFVRVGTLDDARAYIENGPVAMYARCGFGLLRVALKDGTPIGMCGLIRRDSLPDVDIGFAFLPAYRARGYAREAARATMDYARVTVGLRRVVAITSLDNTASARLLETVGLNFESLFPIPGEDRQVRLYAWNAPG
jgi:RimJ/RimL family protein N-acetyltransferase